MTPSPLTAGRKALIARLEMILPENGYFTDAGTRVLSGWVNEVVDEKTEGFPLITVHRFRDRDPEQKPGAIRVPLGFMVNGAVQAGFDEWEEALEALQTDVMQCLIPDLPNQVPWLPKGLTNLQFGAAVSIPPGDGKVCAYFQLPIYLQTVIQGREPITGRRP